MNDTIFAVSSGTPPAAIAVLRVSGPDARTVAQGLAGGVPEARRATLRRLRDGAGRTLDQALVLWFDGPRTATGEDMLELHLHGGRAVISAVEVAIGTFANLRRAEPGEFTRRALLAGRIDLAEANGLADLLEAETETQRRSAIAMAEGALGREVRRWLATLSDIRAQVEAAIDHDEAEIGAIDLTGAEAALEALTRDLDQRLAAPSSEEFARGATVVIAGPPNAGKSSLLNALLDRDVAIVAPIAGTTRDRIEQRVRRSGQIVTLVDTAGLAQATTDPIEAEGIVRSHQAIGTADLMLWLGDDGPPVGPPNLWLRARCDEAGRGDRDGHDLAVSVRQSGTIDSLWALILERTGERLQVTDVPALREQQRDVVAACLRSCRDALAAPDLLVRADHLRVASHGVARLIGVDATEAMLDALFGRFCVGK